MTNLRFLNFILWVEDMGMQYSSSVLANGLVYLLNDEGTITVLTCDASQH